MTTTLKVYAVVFEETGNGYSAYLPDLPGCVAAGDTKEDTERLISEAVAEHLKMLASEGIPIPQPIDAVSVSSV